MKRLCTEVSEEEIVSKVLVENVEATKTAILAELFGLPADASLADIITTPPKLPSFEVKQISEKRLASIKKKYEVIPKEDLWYYPDGDKYLLTRASKDSDKSNADGDDTLKLLPTLEKPKKKAGRPKAINKADSKTPSILNFFKAFPVISKTTSTVSQSPSGSKVQLAANKQPDVHLLCAGGAGDVGDIGNLGNMQMHHQKAARNVVPQLIDDENGESDDDCEAEQIMDNLAQKSQVGDAFDDIFDTILEN